MNITGKIWGASWPNGYDSVNGSGSFYNDPWGTNKTAIDGGGEGMFTLIFDASRSWTGENNII